MPSPPPPPPPPHMASNEPLLLSLLRLCRDLSATPYTFQKLHTTALARRSALLLPLFEDLLRHGDALPRPASLCLAEILSVLRRFHALLYTVSARMSRVRALLQFDSISDQFHELWRDLASLLDILILSGVGVSEDVTDLVDLVRVQCKRSNSSVVDSVEEGLRSDILRMIDDVENGIVPERPTMEALFQRIGLGDSESCKEDIARLEIEIREESGGRWCATMVSLLGIVRYAKCVLFGASTPRTYGKEAAVARSWSFSEDAAVPSDFRCPISLELMRDPVVVASGQTYDRASITKWIDAGHATCPKTGQPLAHRRIIPNLALRNLIRQWCNDEKIPFEVASTSSTAVDKLSDGVVWNKASLEAAKMTALFLVPKLSETESRSLEDLNRIVHELRQLAKTGAENRAFIAEAGAIPLLLPLISSEDPSLQVNSVTAILNLSILEENKKRIMKAPGALSEIAGVLCHGATWQARENAAAALFSISTLHSVYRKRVGSESQVAEGLAELVRSGPASSRRDGLITMLSLAGVRENVGRLVQGGAVAAAVEAARDAEVAEIAVAVLAALAKRGAVEAVGATEGFVARMVAVMREGTDAAKEAAAAALVSVCRAGRKGAMEDLAATPGLEWLLWGLMASGSMRTRRKAASLGKIYRRWLAYQEEEQPLHRVELGPLGVAAQ